VFIRVFSSVKEQKGEIFQKGANMLHGPQDITGKAHIAFIDPATDLIIDHIYGEMTVVEGGETRIGISRELLDRLAAENDLCASDFEEALAKLEKHGVLNRCGNGRDDICVYRVCMALDRIYFVLILEREVVEVFDSIGTVEVLGLGEIEFYKTPEDDSIPPREVLYTLAPKQHVKAVPGYEHLVAKAPELTEQVPEKLLVIRLKPEEAQLLLQFVEGRTKTGVSAFTDTVRSLIVGSEDPMLENVGTSGSHAFWELRERNAVKRSFVPFTETTITGRRRSLVINWPEGRDSKEWLKELRRISCQDQIAPAPLPVEPDLPATEPPVSPVEEVDDLPPEADDVLEFQNVVQLPPGVKGAVIQLDGPMPDEATVKIEDMEDDRLEKALIFAQSLVEIGQQQIQEIEAEQAARAERRRQERIEELRLRQVELQQELEAVQRELSGI
jgi:hypothetical protein